MKQLRLTQSRKWPKKGAVKTGEKKRIPTQGGAIIWKNATVNVKYVRHSLLLSEAIVYKHFSFIVYCVYVTNYTTENKECGGGRVYVHVWLITMIVKDNYDHY